MIEEPAWAKVNLFLHVTGRRADGYHLLDSLAVFAGVGDMVRAAPAATLSLNLDGPFAAGLGAEPDNLVLRAARALSSTRGAALTLEKNLPVASGIGGGSADAAAALRALARLWRLPPSALAEPARALGADVPVCLASAPARMAGIGETLTPAPTMPPYGLLLVNPRAPVATPAVFRARQGPFSPPAELPPAFPDAAALARHLATLRNDLEPPALSLCPAIAPVLAWLRAHPACLLARMSGSGATCFALFRTPSEAEAAAAAAAASWWSWGGAPASPLRPTPHPPM